MWISGKTFEKFLNLQEKYDEAERKRREGIRVIFALARHCGGKVEVEQPPQDISVSYWTDDETKKLVIRANIKENLNNTQKDT